MSAMPIASTLPDAADRHGSRAYTTRRAAPFPRKPARAVQPHRLCGRACRRRSARRRRSVARRRDRLGRDHRLPPASVVARPRRRRGDGHRAARHGARLADLAGADPPQRSTPRKDVPGALIGSRRRHRSSRRRRRRHRRRRDPRLRGAMRGDREARRPHHPDGEPRAGAGGAHRPTTTPGSTAASSAR